MITIGLDEVFRKYADAQAEIQIDAADVGEALRLLFERHPDLRVRVVDETAQLHSYLLLFHNGDQIRSDMATVLNEGDRLDIVAAAAGG